MNKPTEFQDQDVGFSFPISNSFKKGNALIINRSWNLNIKTFGIFMNIFVSSVDKISHSSWTVSIVILDG
jgi:hypothetical protein